MQYSITRSGQSTFLMHLKEHGSIADTRQVSSEAQDGAVQVSLAFFASSLILLGF